MHDSDEAATPTETSDPDTSDTSDKSGPLGTWFDRLGLVVVVIVGLVLRGIARSPLWLDEALTVNISRMPLGRIGPWLRHDGHPPLYYWMLHIWMRIFGTSDSAVRALAGVFGVLLIPLAWLTAKRLGGRRAGWIAVALVAVSPYAVRYSTETRMYSLVMVLVLAGWLLGMDALVRPTWWRFGAVTLITAALLWSHYWAMWLLAAVGLALVYRTVIAHRAGRIDDRDRTAKVVVAMVVGLVLFLPWVPSLLYQSAHTGTPWARPSAPTTVVAQSITEFGGGMKGDNVLLGVATVILALLGIFGRVVSRWRTELDFRTQVETRPLLWVIGGTLVIAMAAMWATNSAFATRYDAVWFPLFMVLAAVGAVRFGSVGLQRGVLVVVLALGIVGSVRTSFTHTRSQARDAAQAIEAHGHPGDLVVTCPDQLGPSLRRELPGTFPMGTYPDLAKPQLVNWVDYQARVNAASPERFADAVVKRANGRGIFLAWASTYRTHVGVCEQVVNAITVRRSAPQSILADDGSFYEHEAVLYYPPAGAVTG